MKVNKELEMQLEEFKGLYESYKKNRAQLRKAEELLMKIGDGFYMYYEQTEADGTSRMTDSEAIDDYFKGKDL